MSLFFLVLLLQTLFLFLNSSTDEARILEGTVVI